MASLLCFELFVFRNAHQSSIIAQTLPVSRWISVICQYLSSELRASSQSNELSKKSRVVMEFHACPNQLQTKIRQSSIYTNSLVNQSFGCGKESCWSKIVLTKLTMLTICWLYIDHTVMFLEAVSYKIYREYLCIFFLSVVPRIFQVWNIYR